MKLYPCSRIDADNKVIAQQYYFWCPGCESPHAFTTRTDGGRPAWTFDGNRESPSFQPSLLCHGIRRCHLFMKNGRLEFLGDCEHKLAGKTVDVPEWNGFDNGESN